MPGLKRSARALILAALALGTALPSRAQAPPETVRGLLAAFDALGGTEWWPGFRAAGIPLAIYEGDRTWLYRHPAPPDEFAATADPLIRVAGGQHPLVRANTSVDLGGTHTATLLLTMAGDAADARDLAAVAIHEAFHAWQRAQHPDWGMGGLGFENPATDTGLLALRRTETELLRRAVAALRTAERDSVAALAAAALEVRSRRFADLPAAIVRYERGVELLEGTAQWVQLRATGSAAGLAALPDTGFAAGDLHARSYAAGLALARLLSALAPGWEAEVDSGRAASLDEALSNALRGTRPASWAELHTDALDRAGPDVTRLVAERERARAAYLQRGGWRIIVVAPEDAPIRPGGVDPMNLVRVGDDELLHTRWLRVSHAAGDAEVNGGSVLTTGAAGEPFARGFRRLTVTGLDAEPELRRDGRTVTLRAGAFSATFREAVVRVDGDALVVELPGEAAVTRRAAGPSRRRSAWRPGRPSDRPAPRGGSS